MKVYRHTLLCEGHTDANLIPILNWLLREKGGQVLVQGRRADPDAMPRKKEGLSKQITAAIEYFEGDLLFVHRDADRATVGQRHEEIRDAVLAACTAGFKQPAVAVVPVRMMEAWLLFDEAAIRRAAGNPNGTVKLALPRLQRLEDRPDPKMDLQQALEAASGLTGRGLKKFKASRAVWRITDYIADFTPLRKLPSFLQLEAAIASLKENHWKPDFYC